MKNESLVNQKRKANSKDRYDSFFQENLTSIREIWHLSEKLALFLICHSSQKQLFYIYIEY